MTPEQITKTIIRLRDAIDRRTKANRVDQQRIYDLEREQHRLDMLALVGVPGGVRMGYRVSARDKAHRLNDLFATLTAVKRTRCELTFENGENWTFPLDDVKAATKEQGIAF